MNLSIVFDAWHVQSTFMRHYNPGWKNCQSGTDKLRRVLTSEDLHQIANRIICATRDDPSAHYSAISGKMFGGQESPNMTFLERVMWERCSKAIKMPRSVKDPRYLIEIKLFPAVRKAYWKQSEDVDTEIINAINNAALRGDRIVIVTRDGGVREGDLSGIVKAMIEAEKSVDVVAANLIGKNSDPTSKIVLNAVKRSFEIRLSSDPDNPVEAITDYLRAA